MTNDYEIRGDVTAIIINSRKNGKIETLISTSDLKHVNDFPYRWCAQFDKTIQSFYVVGRFPKKNGKSKSVYLHRWITDAQKGKVVDHINHNTLDNTNLNLRVVTQSENMQNRKGASSNSKSGVRGVCWNKKDRKWYVRVQVNYVKKHIGSFDDLGKAEQVAREARMRNMPYSKEGELA